MNEVQRQVLTALNEKPRGQRVEESTVFGDLASTPELTEALQELKRYGWVDTYGKGRHRLRWWWITPAGERVMGERALQE